MTPLRQAGMRAGSAFRGIAAAVLLMATVAHASTLGTAWNKPATDLAARIVEVLGPGPVHLTLRNLSAIATDQLPVIHRLIEDALKSGGISLTSSEGANAVRITLSENPSGGLWVAEIVEGNETRVVMQPVDPSPADSPDAKPGVALHREVMIGSSDLQWKSKATGWRPPSQILAVAQAGSGLVILTPELVAIFTKTATG